jgi:uncharacterized protein DUF2190
MSQDVRDFEKTFNSTNDLSAAEFLVVAQDTSNDSAVVGATSATAPVVGILRNKPKANAAALVRMTGTSKVTAGGTITAGDRVTPTTGSKVITTTSSGNTVVGIALQAAVSGDVFEILLTPGAKY